MRLMASLLLAASLAAAPAAVGGDSDDGRRILHGHYTSGFSNGVQRLRAEFTPDGEDTWKVAFFFRWSGQDRIYTGAAEGSLSTGLLHGRVLNEDRTRVFSFRCEFDKKKRCRGKHAEVVRTGEHETGSITLKAPGRG